jgi:hypothetical protein
MAELFVATEELGCAVAEDDVASIETVGDLYERYLAQPLSP